MSPRIPIAGLVCTVVLQLGLTAQMFGQSVASKPATGDPASWEMLEERPADGEQCIVCRQAIHEGEIIEVRYKGRTFHVAASMLEKFEADPDRYFHTLQARAALFDEAAMETPPMRTGWLMFGVYVLVGLVCGAGCSYIALNRGLPARGWFFAGLFVNVAALAAILMTKPVADGALAPPPPGLAKIPATLTPRACPHCGHTDHPSASICSSCAQTLEPAVEPETARA